MRKSAILIALIIATSILSGLVYFKLPAIMGAHALNVAFWGVLCAEILAFITKVSEK
ncbi:MAG: hypothetical protein AB1485_08620 [Candidatus Thermoplasmatota archaeon]